MKPMHADRCQKFEMLLDAFADGALGGHRRAAVKRHLDDCPRCREQLEQLRQMKLLLRDVDATCPPPSPYLRANVMAKVRALSDAERSVDKRTPAWRWAAPLATAACLVLVLTVTLLPGLNKDLGMAPSDPMSPGREDFNASTSDSDVAFPMDPTPPAELPQHPAEGEDVSPEETTYELSRLTSAQKTDGSLVRLLDGEWEGNGMHFIWSAADMNAKIAFPDMESRLAEGKIEGEQLTLYFENGETAVFAVRVKEDTLWLTVIG